MTAAIGQPLDRVDGRAKVTGAGRYSAEIARGQLMGGMLWGLGQALLEGTHMDTGWGAGRTRAWRLPGPGQRRLPRHRQPCPRTADRRRGSPVGQESQWAKPGKRPPPPLGPRAASNAVVTVLLTGLLTWVAMPIVTRVLRPWLCPRQRRISSDPPRSPGPR